MITLHAVRRAHRGARQLLAEEHRAHLAAASLRVKKQWPERRERGLADLALDPHVGERRVGVEERADAPVEVGDAQDARRGAQGGGSAGSGSGSGSASGCP